MKYYPGEEKGPLERNGCETIIIFYPENLMEERKLPPSSEPFLPKKILELVGTGFSAETNPARRRPLIAINRTLCIILLL